MGIPGRASVLSRPSTPKRAPFSRFWRWGRGRPSTEADAVEADPLLAAGRHLRQRREERRLTLRELALETRISTPVLEALERGWRDRLPEATYLRTMLPLIERHLDLAPGSLVAVLPSSPAPSELRQRDGLVRRFTPGSIDVFTTWQGSVLYGLLTLGLVYGLNLQQQHLAAKGLLVMRPVPPLSPQEQASQPGSGQLLLDIYPDLRPLQQAAEGQSLKSLGSTPANSGGKTSQGTLKVRLTSTSTMRLNEGGRGSIQLQAAKGELVMDLRGPWSLTIDPPPISKDAVSWKGQVLTPNPKTPNTFRRPKG